MLILFFFAHLVADFLMQPLWLVQRKRSLDGLAIHVGLVLLCMLALGVVEPRAWALWPAMLVISTIHFAMDWSKVHVLDGIAKHPIGPFLVDQAVHLLTLIVVLGTVLPADALWQTSSPLLTMLAILGCGYVIAMAAVPIGVMIWLDPRFTHVAMALPARGRCAALGAACFTLTYFASAAVLPFAVLSMLLMVRRNTAGHPLDQPLGQVSVLFAATLLGTVLHLLM